MGKIAGNRLNDASGKLLGRNDGDRIYGKSGRNIGRIERDRIYDGSGKYLARVEGLTMAEIVLFCFFYMELLKYS